LNPFAAILLTSKVDNAAVAAVSALGVTALVYLNTVAGGVVSKLFVAINRQTLVQKLKTCGSWSRGGALRLVADNLGRQRIFVGGEGTATFLNPSGSPAANAASLRTGSASFACVIVGTVILGNNTILAI